MSRVNDDFREVLTSHLMTERDKGYISGWLRSGENNRGIAQRLSLAFASRAETVTLETGDIADYFTSTVSMAVEIQDKFGTKLSLSWEAVAPILRALWMQELDGFSHEPVQRDSVELAGQLTYREGDKVAFGYGDHDIAGTIEYIGDLDVRIHTGPYAWSHETVSRDFFEDALRHDERNAALFTSEVPAAEVPPPGPTAVPGPATIYPGDKNGLPYDIVVQTLRFDEPEQAQPEQAPATEQDAAARNFRITDDDVGVGTQKEKFRRNMEAIDTLQGIELEGRSATPAEQEILSQYVGWGGLPDAFDPDKPGWTEEFLELQAALTPEEYASARASTLNAHYTRPTIVKAIYEAVEGMGFQTGNILEPSCGIGNFFGLLPESMAASRLYGVELDSITGRIAQQLYPDANISIQGFEKSEFPDGFFDLAIGNVPFGGYKLVDRRYDRENLLIHDYFFAKTIDKVRSGGVIAFVTSNGISGGTMDKKDRHAREYIARRCHLLGAIRLPNNASLANAGTEAGMDIVFLQKRDVPLTRDEPLPGWVDVDVLEQHTYTGGDGVEKRGHVTMSRYFQAHPEMVLGTPEITSGPFGAQLVCQPTPGADLAQQLHEAVSHIQGEYREAETPELDADINEPEIAAIPADPSVKNFSYAIIDGEVYYRQNSVMVKPNLTASARERVKGMVELRDCVQQLIDMQMNEYTPDSAIQEKQGELSQLYDGFAKKHGLINDRANRLAFSADSAYYLLCALEVLDEDGRLERKADMFTKRTIKPHQAVTSADTAMDALAVSIGERACVDLPFMAQLTGKTEDELTAELRGVIFKDPAAGSDPLKGWQTADEYLSGNVRQKLKAARAAAEHDPAYQGNVDALLAAQPKDLDASEIEARLGATWIDKQYVQQFMYETLKTPYYLKGRIKVSYSEHTAEWSISNKGSVSDNDIAAYSTFGTGRANAYRILEDSLNLRDVRIYDTIEDADGKEKRVLNAKETTLAAQKQQALRDAFREWIFKDPQRRQALVRQYNEEMNCIRPREYDGSHIVFSGINPEIDLQPHQVNAIAHVLYGGNTLLAHEVGAGKTFEMIAAAMESKRLGLCHKSIFVVPNHLTEQTAAEFLRLYPSANILVTTKRDFEKHRRKKFCARIATGDYDAVIIGHSQFEKIPISYARQERLIFEQINEITDGIQELKNSGAEKFSVKQLERTKRNLEARLEKLQANHRKDDVVTFEQLGVDMMFVDESDNYKNLFLYTKMRNVAGLATSDAQKSSDMFAKCRYLDEITHGRGVVFATGTPISNSMTEMYTIQRYLQYDRLQEMGMGHFDCWASRFGETVTALELAPEGTGYRARTRFARFFNLPELMNMFKEVADIKTADQLDLPTPEVEYHTVASKPTEIQKEMVKELSKRASRVHSGTVDPREDNMLKITSDGRKLGLDQRIINPMLPDEEGTKVNRCVENILQCWRDGDSQKLTQLVFCDISTPKAAPSKRALKGGGDKLDSPTLHMLENAIPLEPEKPFTIYEDIRRKLIAGGMAPEQIAFIHEANTDVQKKELFAKVCTGQVRVLLGSTFKMGAGTNVQDLLIALHDLDCPWRPRDLTQRKGRIERRGNNNKKVHVYRYVTEGTFDAYLWQTVENKQKFISQIMTSKSPMRSCEDVDEAALSYAEIKALCAGDPRIKERMELDVDVSRLKVMKAAHQSKQYELEDSLMKYFPEQIRQYQGYIKGLEADMKTLAEHPHPTIIKEIPATATAAEGQEPVEPAAPAAVAKEVSQGFAGMVVKGTAYEGREAAGMALLEACKEVKDAEPVLIGSYRGFTMSVSVSLFKHKLALKGEMTHETDLGTDVRGNLMRIDHALEKMPDRLMAIKAQLDNLFAQQEAAKGEVGKPFPQEDELREKSARLAELDALLNIDGGHRQEEQAIAKCARPSVLDGLKRPAQPGPDRKMSKAVGQEL
jgi:N12 class adenine-specific DNA methylase